MTHPTRGGASPHPSMWRRVAALTVASLLVACGAESGPAADVGTLERSVGRIFCETATGRGSGTGFVIAEGKLVTNHHVVAPPGGGTCETLEVAFEPGVRQKLTILEVDARRDLALASFEGSSPPPLKISAEDDLAKSAALIVIGFPGGADQNDDESWKYVPASVSNGIVSRQHTDPDNVMVVQTNATMNPGNSGGPMLDTCGRVLGVATRVRRGLVVEGLNWGVHGVEVRAFLEGAKQDHTAEAGACGAPATPTRPALVALSAVALLGLGFVVWRRRPRGIEAPGPGGDRRPAIGPGPGPDAPRRAAASIRFLTGPLEGDQHPVSSGDTVGRDAEIADILLPERTPGVSRRHVEFWFEKGGWTVRDCWSSGGTRVDGRALTPGERTVLRPGATVVLGDDGVSFRWDEAPA